MDVQYRLTGVEQVAINECVNSWMVRGECTGGFARLWVDYPHDQDRRAHALAQEWCQQKGFQQYKMYRFTDEPYIFLVSTVDVETSEIVEEHTEDYS